MNIKNIIKQYNKWLDEFDPSNYGYTMEEYNNDLIDLKYEFVHANYGNTNFAKELIEVL